jgi:diguanylate cyclase (GGDEF)-like protein
MSGKPAILVVDDDPMVRFLAEESLSSSFDVDVACHGLDGLAMFEKKHYQLILLDLMMPQMDGLTTCHALHQLLGGEDVPVILMTAADDVASIERAYQSGVTDFVVKPVNWMIIEHRIRYLLRSTQLMYELKMSESRLERAQKIARLGCWEYIPRRNCFWGSSEFYSILEIKEGASGRDVLKKVLAVLFKRDRIKFVSFLKQVLHRDLDQFHFDLGMKFSSGEIRYCTFIGQITTIRGELKFVGTLHDVTGYKLIEQKLRANEKKQSYRANHDSLTGLPNRLMFLDKLQHFLEQARRHRRKAALFFLDLDGFKAINDSLGHDVGDIVLKTVSVRLREQLRNVDTVARLGGDEFVILIEEIGSIENIHKVVVKLLECFDEPLSLKDYRLKLAVSIGSAIYPDDGSNEDELLRHADLAMYEAKKFKQSKHVHYSGSKPCRESEAVTRTDQIRLCPVLADR